MIQRYTRQEMGQLWDSEARFNKMMEVEIAVAEVQAGLGIIPRVAARDIAKKSAFSVKRIQQIEAQTKHDVIAFVSCVAENVGPHGRYLHFGMTSSDVLDTAFSLQVIEASRLISSALLKLDKTMVTLIKKHKDTLCAGRTHGMFAEPTSFGLKLSGYLAELRRNQERFQKAVEQMRICKLSGAVGTYSSQPPEVEAKLAKKLGLKIETIATQVIPRDRHAEIITALAFIGAGLERLSVELRHLQRSEVAEVTEGFTPGQKGSSAMPHKKNPISAENISGAARLLRSYMLASHENICLWHERDISHSSVERVIFPDAFILCDYIIHRMVALLEGLYVDRNRMKENIESSQGVLFSSQVLLHLVDQGMSREEAYKHVQRVSHSLMRGEHLKSKILKDSELKNIVMKKEIEKIFSGDKQQVRIRGVVARVLKGKS